MRGGLGPTPVAAPRVPAAPALRPPAARRGPAPIAVRPRRDALLYVVLGVILTDVWRFHDLVPATRVVRPSLALTAIGLVLLAATTGALSSALGRLRSPIAFWFAILVALMLAGIPFSIEPALSWEAFSSTFLPHMLAGFLVLASVRSVEDAEFLAFGALVGAFVYTLFVNLTTQVSPEGRWIGGPYYDVNDLALMLVVTIPLTLYFGRRENSTFRRVFAGACFVLFAYSIVQTGSRGGFVGFAVVLGYLLLRFTALPRRARLAGAVAAALVLAVGGEAYLRRLETIVRPGRDYNVAQVTGRVAIWRRGLGYVESRPLLGLGLHQFRTAESRYWSFARRQRMTGGWVPPARGAHNMYLQVAAELGVPALIAFVALLWVGWRALTRARDHCAPDRPAGSALAGALAASLLGFCICGIFLHAALFPVLPTLLGFAVALAAVCGVPTYAPRPGRGGLASGHAPPAPPVVAV